MCEHGCMFMSECVCACQSTVHYTASACPSVDRLDNVCEWYPHTNHCMYTCRIIWPEDLFTVKTQGLF